MLCIYNDDYFDFFIFQAVRSTHAMEVPLSHMGELLVSIEVYILFFYYANIIQYLACVNI